MTLWSMDLWFFDFGSSWLGSTSAVVPKSADASSCQFHFTFLKVAEDAASLDLTSGGKYAIYVWSIQTGNVLEVLSGHTSHVQSLHFSPSAAHPGQLVSASWDGTLRFGFYIKGFWRVDDLVAGKWDVVILYKDFLLGFQDLGLRSCCLGSCSCRPASNFSFCNDWVNMYRHKITSHSILAELLWFKPWCDHPDPNSPRERSNSLDHRRYLK